MSAVVIYIVTQMWPNIAADALFAAGGWLWARRHVRRHKQLHQDVQRIHEHLGITEDE